MKKSVSITVMMLLLVSVFAFAQKPAKQEKPAKAISKIEVYYFHYSRRCVTCNTVESETKKAIETLYPEQFKNGSIAFMSVNLDEKSSEQLAKKCKAEGQSLLVVSGSRRADLTDKGFMYAKSSPDKLRAEIKKTIDALL